MTNSPRKLAPWLWLLLVLFCGRVLGQLIVAQWSVSWLPPMEQWYSGLLPYPFLLPAQIIIIALYTRICVDFTRGDGFFVKPRPVFANGARIFGYIYLGAMILRYIIRMTLHPDQRWFGGTIPIFFHWVLAGFILLFAHHHKRKINMFRNGTG